MPTRRACCRRAKCNRRATRRTKWRPMQYTFCRSRGATRNSKSTVGLQGSRSNLSGAVTAFLLSEALGRRIYINSFQGRLRPQHLPATRIVEKSLAKPWGYLWSRKRVAVRRSVSSEPSARSYHVRTASLLRTLGRSHDVFLAIGTCCRVFSKASGKAKPKNVDLFLDHAGASGVCGLGFRV